MDLDPPEPQRNVPAGSSHHPPPRCICPSQVPANLTIFSQLTTQDRDVFIQNTSNSLSSLCRNHLRIFAGKAFGLKNSLSQQVLVSHITTTSQALINGPDSLTELHNAHHSWFRKPTLGPRPQDLIQPYKYFPYFPILPVVDPINIFQRIATLDAWDKWQEDGTINLHGILDHLDDPILLNLFRTEFKVYLISFCL